MKTDQSRIILFDGVCNLCNGAVQFIIRNDAHGNFKFASLQSDFAKNILKRFDIPVGDLQSILLIDNDKVYQKSDAALEIAKNLKGVWSGFYVLRFIPRFFRDGVYQFIAKNRYRTFGKMESCMIPTPELKSRFLD